MRELNVTVEVQGGSVRCHETLYVADDATPEDIAKTVEEWALARVKWRWTEPDPDADDFSWY